MKDKKLRYEAWKRGANSIGWGRKRPDEPERIIFGVPIKHDVHWSRDLNLITSEYSGVVQTGNIKALSNTDKMRPAFPGCSIGHYQITAGTFGCVVFRNGVKFILSNNHVLANSNDAEIGDIILQPGPYDGGNFAKDQIATLREFVPIRFMGEDSTCPFSKGSAQIANGIWKTAGKKTRFKAVAHTTIKDAVFNLVDCAIAQPLDSKDIGEQIINIGLPNGTARGELEMGIVKSGRTTGLTSGNIIQTDVTVQVDYGGKIAVFEDQLMAGAMSQGGDSGSAILNNKNQVVGLLFAGSDSTTIINRIEHVQSALGVTI